eukprot:5800590-Pyramimonas_sp.AAC.1
MAGLLPLAFFTLQAGAAAPLDATVVPSRFSTTHGVCGCMLRYVGPSDMVSPWSLLRGGALLRPRLPPSASSLPRRACTMRSV